MTADNTFECWINGQRAGSGDDFHRGYAMDVGSLLEAGEEPHYRCRREYGRHAKSRGAGRRA